MSEVYEIADHYVEAFAASIRSLRPAPASPVTSTSSPTTRPTAPRRGPSSRRDARRSRHRPTRLGRDRIAAEVMSERLEHASTSTKRANGCATSGSSAARSVRSARCFDLMAYDTPDDWEIVAARMARVPARSPASRPSLREGMARGIIAARRQALACADQAATWGGDERRSSATSRPGIPATRVSRDAAAAATAAYARARGVPPRGVRAGGRPARSGGRERYTLGRARSTASSSTSTRPTRGAGRSSTGSRTRCDRVAERIIPGDAVPDVIDHLDHDPNRSIEGVDEFQRWNQDADRHDDRRARRHALRHPRAGAARRGDDRAARRRGGDVLHGPVRGLLPPRPHLVPDARQHALPALGRGVDLLPRGRPRPSPAGRAGALPRRPAVALPARVRVRLRARRGLGAVRRAAHGRARLPRRGPAYELGMLARRRCARCA